MARLSRKLVELACDVPLPEPLEDFELAGHSRGAAPRVPRASRLQDVARASSARSPTRRSPSPRRGSPACPKRKTRRAITMGTRPWSTKPRSTPGSPPRGIRAGWRSTPRPPGSMRRAPNWSGSAWRSQPNRACYIPLAHGGTDMFAEKPVQLDRDVALAKLKPLFEDPGVLKIGHNIKYDLIVLGRAGEVWRDRGRAVRRHDRDELRPRRRAARPRHGRARRDASVAQLHRVQGRRRHRQEAARVRRNRSEGGDALRRRGCRRDLAAVAPVQAAAARRAASRASTKWSTARSPR